MAKIGKLKINQWSRGIISSPRQPLAGGADRVFNFDVSRQEGVMYPTKAWTRLTDDEESKYGFRAIGVDSNNNLYASGKGLSTWLAPNWTYRIEITIDRTAFPATTTGIIDLSELSSNFWNNVDDDGSGIRVTNSSHNEIAFYLRNFDKNNQTGYLWVTNITDSIYLYFGYDASGYSVNSTYGRNNTFLSLATEFFGFDSKPDDATSYTTSNTWTDGATISYRDNDRGSYGAENTFYENTVNLTSYDNDMFMGCRVMIKDDQNVDVYVMYANDPLVFGVFFDTSRNAFSFRTNRTSGTITVDNTVTVTPGTWYTVHAWFDGTTQYLGVNGTVVSNSSNTNDIDFDGSDNVHFNSDEGAIIYDAFFGSKGSSWTEDKHDSVHAAYVGSIIDSEGSLETFSTHSKYFDGVQLYTLASGDGSGDWTGLESSTGIAKSFSYYPTPGVLLPISSSSVRWFVSQNDIDAGNEGFYYLADYTPMDPTADLLTTNIVSDGESYPVLVYYIEDGKYYFTKNSSTLGTISSGGVYAAAGFSGYATIESICTWGQYLAYVSDFRQYGVLEIKNTSFDNISDAVDFGVGRPRVVGTAGSNLFVVVNNYVDESTLTPGALSVDIMLYSGGGTTQQISRWEFPTNMDNYYTEEYKSVVSNLTARTKNGTAWFGRMKDRDETIKTGLWAVTANEQSGALAFTLLHEISFETDLSDEVIGMTALGSRVFILTDDHNVYSNDGGYTNTSEWVSPFYTMDDFDTVKKLRFVKLYNEPLESGQTVSLYYRTSINGSWVKILENTTENSQIKRSDNKTSDGDFFEEFNEVQFKIESTGGASGVIELEASYEELTKHN